GGWCRRKCHGVRGLQPAAAHPAAWRGDQPHRQRGHAMESLSDERGAVAVMVAGLLVVLIGCAALAIDVSSLYQERRTLQNSADSGALAVAKDCAKTTCDTSKANTFTNANADDGASTVDEV